VLKGTRFMSADAVKAKVMELTNKLSEDKLQLSFQQWKMHMEQCRDQGGGCTLRVTFPLCSFYELKIF
jgi:hypothetical protein